MKRLLAILPEYFDAQDALCRHDIESRAGSAAAEMQVNDGIAVITVIGGLYRYSYWGDSYAAIERQIAEANVDSRVSTILLQINSPGGSVDGMYSAADAIQASAKPVIAQVQGMCCSAAYYLASQARKVYAERNDTIGSIGCFIVLYDTSKYFENAGVKTIVISSGTHKGLGQDGVPIAPELIEECEAMVAKHADEFQRAIVDGRSMSKADVKGLATGQVWMSAEAKKLGLIDGISSMAETIAKIRNKRNEAAARKNRAQAILKIESMKAV